MIATLDRLQALARKLGRVSFDGKEPDLGILLISRNERALLQRLADEYLIESEEILFEEERINTAG